MLKWFGVLLVAAAALFGVIALLSDGGSGQDVQASGSAAAEGTTRSATRQSTLAAQVPPAASPTAVAATALPPLPPGWPQNLQIGVHDSPGGAQGLLASAPVGFRYQYLAGGANTGTGWATWSPDGAFVSDYIRESVAAGIHPVFTYYMIFQSAPGIDDGEFDGVFNNLQNTSTMTAYWNDLKLFFQRAGAFRESMVVLHVEPDMWGFLQQRATDNNAATVPVQVGSTGLRELAGIPNTLAGLAQGVIKLRDTYAPNVLLAYHLSIWGTGDDITYSDPPLGEVGALARVAGRYYASLGADFDLVFSEFSDRDAGFKEDVYGDGGASWWDEGDFARNLRFLEEFVRTTGERVVVWQIPLGNTKMRAQDNTWNHYQDNRVEWLLDDPGRAHLKQYVDAGVIAFLFGRGSDGVTCSCDANGDGVTNPAPINGNDGMSLNADDDGGFFWQKTSAYYAAGPLPLP